MGAISIVRSARGKSMQEAFTLAQEEAEDEYGTDTYNGEINNCELISDVTHKLKSMSEDKLQDWMIQNCDKREVMGYCKKQPKGNTNKIKTKVDRFPQHGTRKWKTVYEAVTLFGGSAILEDESQTECIKRARAYVEKHPNTPLDIRITKKLVEGKEKCATVSYKPSSGESDGVYVFAGMAPY